METPAIILIGLVCFVGQSVAFHLNVSDPSIPNGAESSMSFPPFCGLCDYDAVDGSTTCVGCEDYHIAGAAAVQEPWAEYPGCCRRYIDPMAIYMGKHPNLCEILVEGSSWTSPDCKICTCQEGEIVCEDKCEAPEDPSLYVMAPGESPVYPACCPVYQRICDEGRQFGETWILEGNCGYCRCERSGVTCIGGCPYKEE